MSSVRVEAVTVRGEAMEYIRFGCGTRPLIVLAGMSLNGITDAPEEIVAVNTEFAKEYEVFVFDRHPTLAEGTTVTDMAEDTACALDALGIRDADVMGFSQGGMVALCLAIDRPELVHALLLVSTMCRPNPVSEETFSLWRDTALTGNVEAVNEVAFSRIYTERFRKENAGAFAALLPIGTPERCRRFAVLSEACRTFDRADELSRIRCPALVMGVWGDAVLSGEASVTIAEKLGCEVHMYEGYGHSICTEAPDFQRRSIDFFRRTH